MKKIICQRCGAQILHKVIVETSEFSLSDASDLEDINVTERVCTICKNCNDPIVSEKDKPIISKYIDGARACLKKYLKKL